MNKLKFLVLTLSFFSPGSFLLGANQGGQTFTFYMVPSFTSYTINPNAPFPQIQAAIEDQTGVIMGRQRVQGQPLRPHHIKEAIDWHNDETAERGKTGEEGRVPIPTLIDEDDFRLLPSDVVSL